MIQFRRTILIIVAFGLFWSFNISASSNFTIDFSGKLTPSQNMSEEEEDPESHNVKFFSNSSSISLLQFSFNYHNRNSQTLLSNFSPIPTTPPDC